MLVPWRPFFWFYAEVVCVLGAMTRAAYTRCYVAIGNATRA